MKKRVKFYTPEISFESNLGGIATFYTHLGKLVSQECEVEVVTLSQNTYSRRYYRDNISVVSLGKRTDVNWVNIVLQANRFLFSLFPGVMLFFEENIRFFTYYWQHDREQSFIFHTHVYNAATFFLVFLRRRQSVLHLHGPSFLINANDGKNLFRKWCERILIAHCPSTHRIIACSENLRTNIRESLSVSPDIEVIENPFYPEMEAKHNSSQKEKAILFWGSFQTRKNVQAVIRIYQQISLTFPEIKLVLIGGDIASLSLEHQMFCTENKNALVYPYIEDRVSLLTLLRRYVGVAIFPSLYEPFGYVALESTSLGYETAISPAFQANFFKKHADFFLLLTENKKDVDMITASLQRRQKSSSERKWESILKEHNQNILKSYKNMYKEMSSS